MSLHLHREDAEQPPEHVRLADVVRAFDDPRCTQEQAELHDLEQEIRFGTCRQSVVEAQRKYIALTDKQFSRSAP